MPGKVSMYSSGAQVGNKLGSKAVVQANKDVIDQLGLSATISRVKNIKAQYRAVPQEGKRVSEAVQQKGRTLASTGAERADQLRNIVDKSIGQVQTGSSKENSRKTSFIQSLNTPPPIEAGKGSNLNSSA